MQKLRAEEVELIGQWQSSTDQIIEDDTCKRIRQLVQNQLIRVAVDPSGWKTLYRDPQDSRLWELSYPQGELHGGGPPKLACISAEHAEAVYDVKV